MENKKIKVGITQGDINGVGIEVIIKTFSDNLILNNCIPVIYGSTKAFGFYRKMLNPQNFNLNVINNASEIHPNRINIINCVDGDDIKVELGQTTEAAANISIEALERATTDIKDGLIDVLLTAPINKKNIKNDKFIFSNQTEYLESTLATKGDAIMLLLDGNIKIASLTGQLSLKDSISMISEDFIVDKVTLLNKMLLEDFGINKPRIAILGLNPNASVNGELGKEEKETILPAIKKLNENDILCVGPFAADHFFGIGKYAHFDLVVSMYYDQGAIPFKTIAMDRGVLYTAGLPIVRTAPTHGVEFEVAGQGAVLEWSFRNALYEACDIHINRISYLEISKEPPLKRDERNPAGVND